MPSQAGRRGLRRRWQAEIAYYRIKVGLRGAGAALRGHSRLARQEIWGMLVVYNALCDLAAQTAVSLGVDLDQICFVAVLRQTRDHLAAANHACQRCGERPSPDLAAQTLIDDIAASPRNRTGRQRTSPPHQSPNAEPSEPATSRTP
jgi:hypothetical protein